MNWSEEDEGEAIAAWNAAPDGERMRAAMTRAVALVAARGGTMTAEQVHDALDDLGDSPAQRALWRHIAAQSARVAALEAEVARLKERATKAAAELRHAYRTKHDWELVARAIRILEEATTERPDTSADMSKCTHLWVTVNRGKQRCELCLKRRYPCSPTCTHEDNATPGHPARVKELSAMVKAEIDAAERHISADVIGKAYDGGAEAMRAACREAVSELLSRKGYSDKNPFRESLMAAIESATT